MEEGALGNLTHRARSLQPIGQPIANSGFFSLTDAGSRVGIEFNLTTQRPRDDLPSLMLQYWTARSAAAKLQAEKETLQLQLRSLQHHLSLHKFHVKSAYETKEEAKLRTDTCQETLRLLDVRRKVLADSHLASVHGSHVGMYRTLLTEHLQLEDQFRKISASQVATRYTLQKLIIDTVRAHSKVPLQAVRGSR